MNNTYCIKDISLSQEGERKIAWVADRMPVLNRLAKKFQEDGIFEGNKIAVSIHLEAKTAYLCLILQKLGAEVWVTGSNPFSTKNDVAAALAEKGIHVFAQHGANEDLHREELNSVLSCHPDVVLDDGADICIALHKRPELGDKVKGISEETTTGVMRLKQLLDSNKLLFPAITVNEAKSKHMFDNRYGTGQSTWTAITHLTNMTVGGQKVVILGYGWVGRGVATIARGMGGHVIITELDPWKALEAVMDGYEVMPINDACQIGDIFITTTGRDSALKREHLINMKHGAIIGNAGHADTEIEVDKMNSDVLSIKEVRENVFEYKLLTGRLIYLLANGRIVNIAGGSGHPVEIMDMSFSLQLASLHYLLRTPKMEIGLYNVPEEIDEIVVREKLAAEGYEIDT